MVNYETHKECLICGGKKLNKLERYHATYLVKCAKCSFVFAERIPTIPELIEHYETTYSRTDYLSEITIKRYHEILDTFEPYRKTNKLIDVGCGIGHFLKVAKERGWDVYGTEFTDDAMEICRSKGINMIQGKLDPNNYKPGEFDVVTSFEVLEHIYNPIEEMTNFKTLLRNDGIVYLTTPNFNSLQRYTIKEKYNVISYPEHLSYYTPKTLKNLFDRIGFEKLKIESTGISLTRLKTSISPSKEKYIAEDSVDEKLRQSMDSNKLMGMVKNVVNGILTTTGKGDALKGLFIKTSNS